MKKFILSAAASAAAMALAAPAGAVTVVLVEENGNLTGEFGATITSQGNFTSEFTFTLPEDGFTSSTISTVRVSALTDINFSSVLLNGTAFSLTPNGTVEFGALQMLFTPAGLNTLTVNGFSGGNGSFAGTISFIPAAAVPEPGTWALLLLGFAGIGLSMRRSKPSVREARVRYNFA